MRAQLYDAYGQPLAVKNKSPLANPSGLLRAGVDENGVGRSARIESKFNAKVRLGVSGFLSRFSPVNNDTLDLNSIPYQVTTSPALGTSSTGAFITADGITFGLTGIDIVSDNANDTAGGSGIREVAIVYWSYLLTPAVSQLRRSMQLVTMNGTNPVSIGFNGRSPLDPNSVGFVVEKFYATKIGSGGSAAGNVSVSGNFYPIQISVGETSTIENFVISNSALYITSVFPSNKTTGTFNLSCFQIDLVAMAQSGGGFDYASSSILAQFVVGTSPPQPLTYNPPIYVSPPPNNCLNMISLGTTPVSTPIVDGQFSAVIV